MDVSTAFMVLLFCSSGGVDCREMRGTQSYDTVSACRKALPAVLQRLSGANQHVIGRCALAGDFSGLDGTATGSVSPMGKENDRTATVRVTRLHQGVAVTTSYNVPAGETQEAAGQPERGRRYLGTQSWNR